MPKPPLYKNLTFQVLAAIVIGAIIGYVDPPFGVALKPLGDGFIRLIKMVVAPIIFLTVVCGIASMGDLKKVGRVGLKALIYFEIVTTLALAIGLLVGNLLPPGTSEGRGISSMVPIDAKDAEAVAKLAKQGESQTAVEILLHIIPDNVFEAFAKGDLIQVLFFSVLFSLAMSSLGMSNSSLMTSLEELTEVMFRIVGFIMKVGSLGAMGAMAFTVGKFGLKALGPLAKLVGCVYLTMFLFIFIVLGFICWWYGFSLLKYLRFIREEILLVLGTSTSESALPRMIEKLELMGCHPEIVRLVIPTGYSFNLDGTSIYLSMAVLFIAQAYEIPMSLWQQLCAMAMLMLTSKGAAAVAGGGFITLAATLGMLSSIGLELPVEGLALLYGVDRFMSTARAITNLIGNGVATIVVSKMEREFSQERYEAAMAGHALSAPPPGGFSPEVIGDVAADPVGVDPPV